MRFLAQSIVTVWVLGVAVVGVTACGGRADDSSDGTSRSTNTNKDDDSKSDDAQEADGGAAGDDSQGAENDDAKDEANPDDESQADDGSDDEETGGDAPGSSPGSPDGTTTGGTGTGMPAPTATTTSSPPISMPTSGPIAPPPSMLPGKPVPGGTGMPAEGCSEVTKTVGANYCQQSVSCSNDYVYSSCSGLADGTWECSCSSYYTAGSYQLTGVNEETACAPVLEYCLSGTAPTAELGETACDPTQLYVDVNYCSSSQTCRRTGAISDTVSSLAYDSISASCSPTGTGSLSCYCGSNTKSLQYELTDAPLDTACTTVMDLCTGAVEPEFPAEPTCTQNSRTEGTNQCDVGLLCTRSATLDSGEQAVLSENKSAYCSATAAGPWSCNCSTSSSYLSFQLAADTLADNRCMGAIAFCEPTTAIEPAGEITCTNTSQSVSGDYCSAQSTCIQNADVDGVSIGLFGNLNTSCSSDGAGGFTCSCNSDTESAAVPAEGEELWDVCTNAAKLCPDLVTVNINTGNSNTGVGIGRPNLPIAL